MSLFRQADSGKSGAVIQSDVSWMYEPTDPPRVFKLDEVLTVMVVETSQVTSDNSVRRRKRGQLDLDLANFIRLKGLSAQPTDAGQQINGTLQGQFQASSTAATADPSQFSIQARVVDIRPDGCLVLEGHQTLINKEEKRDRTLTGVVRPEDVLPNNTVLSEKVVGLKIERTKPDAKTVQTPDASQTTSN